MTFGLDLPASLLKLPLLAQKFGYPKVLAGSNFGHYKVLLITRGVGIGIYSEF